MASSHTTPRLFAHVRLMVDHARHRLLRHAGSGGDICHGNGAGSLLRRRPRGPVHSALSLQHTVCICKLGTLSLSFIIPDPPSIGLSSPFFRSYCTANTVRRRETTVHGCLRLFVLFVYSMMLTYSLRISTGTPCGALSSHLNVNVLISFRDECRQERMDP